MKLTQDFVHSSISNRKVLLSVSNSTDLPSALWNFCFLLLVQPIEFFWSSGLILYLYLHLPIPLIKKLNKISPSLNLLKYLLSNTTCWCVRFIPLNRSWLLSSHSARPHGLHTRWGTKYMGTTKNVKRLPKATVKERLLLSLISHYYLLGVLRMNIWRCKYQTINPGN